MSEKRNFKMHRDLLRDVIKRQAGSLAKSILEGVMNAVDAKATECHIRVTEDKVTITDNGTGIQTREEIEQFFETFGGYSDEQRSKKTFGAFRMGRGQLMSYGHNEWRTGKWRMIVDVDNKGLEYELAQMKESKPGCRIVVKLYKPLKPSEMGETERQVSRWVGYAPIKVYYGDELVSKDPTEEKWDHVTAEAYVRLKPTGTLSIFNLGIHVADIDGCRFGCGGVIISRKQLRVNFARNDIQDDCPVWRKIKPFIRKLADREARRSKSLSDWQRQRLIDSIVDGTARPDAYEAKLFMLVNGRHIAMHELDNYRYQNRLTACPTGDVLGDKLYQRKAAVVLSNETLVKFKVADVTALVKLLKRRMPEELQYIKVVEFKTLTKGMDLKYVMFDAKQLTQNELLWLDVMSESCGELRLATEDKRRHYRGRHNTRRTIIGEGPASGWTDGETYIVVTRAFLKTIDFNLPGFHRLGRLYLHELCHGESSAATHIHTQEFYELFHNSADSIGLFVDRCLQKLPMVLARHERKATKKMLKAQDIVVVAKRAKIPA